MYKTINFYDQSIDIFYIEAGTSLKEALGKDFKKFAEKFLEGGSRSSSTTWRSRWTSTSRPAIRACTSSATGAASPTACPTRPRAACTSRGGSRKKSDRQRHGGRRGNAPAVFRAGGLCAGVRAPEHSFTKSSPFWRLRLRDGRLGQR